MEFHFSYYLRKTAIILHTFIRITVAALIYFIIFQIFYNWMRWLTPWPYEDTESLFLTLAYNSIPIFTTFYLIYLIVFLTRNLYQAWLKISIDTLLSTSLLIIINLTFQHITEMKVDWGGTFFNELLILLGIETYYYVKNYNREIREKGLAREQALQYKYEALKAQIDPHFLFNSLNILNSLIEIDQKKSKDFIISLSRIYRYIMVRQNEDKVTIEEELSFLKNYIEILEIRYAGRLKVNLQIDNNDVLQKKIIPYTLQLLMENVCKHNVISSRYPMEVKIKFTTNGITFENPIIPKKAETVSRIGTRYLTNLYGIHNLEIKTQKTNGQYKVHIPYLL